MGYEKNIKINMFPKQGRNLNKRVNVCFHHEKSKTIEGTIVREDIEEPFIEIIKLDDGRYVLDTECQYTIIS